MLQRTQRAPSHSRRLVGSVMLCLICVALLAGCDKIQIPDLGQGGAAAPAAPGAEAAAKAAAANTPAPASVDIPAQSAKPDAKVQVAALLEKNKSVGSIIDQDLLSITELTEGLDEVKQLTLIGQNISDRGVATLSKFPALEAVDLSSSLVTNGGLEVIKSMPQLRSLKLVKTAINDMSMGMIGDHPGLKEVAVSQTTVTDVGLSELGDLQELEVLEISGTGINGSGFEAFKTNKRLRVLRADHSGVQGAAMKYLANCPIEELNLDATGMNDVGMEYIGRMRHMKKLQLEFTGVSDFGLKKMVPMKDLESISFRNNAGISGFLFNKIKMCKNLRTVNVVGCDRITPAECAALMKLIPGLRVSK